MLSGSFIFAAFSSVTFWSTMLSIFVKNERFSEEYLLSCLRNRSPLPLMPGPIVARKDYCYKYLKCEIQIAREAITAPMWQLIPSIMVLFDMQISPDVSLRITRLLVNRRHFTSAKVGPYRYFGFICLRSTNRKVMPIFIEKSK